MWAISRHDRCRYKKHSRIRHWLKHSVHRKQTLTNLQPLCYVWQWRNKRVLQQFYVSLRKPYWRVFRIIETLQQRWEWPRSERRQIHHSSCTRWLRNCWRKLEQRFWSGAAETVERQQIFRTCVKTNTWLHRPTPFILINVRKICDS